jgi:hypothetical protein
VRRQEDLGTEQRGCPSVLDDVVIVADQDAHPTTVRGVEDGVLVSGPQVRAHEGVELSMARPASVRHGDQIRVEQLPIPRTLDQPRTDRHPMRTGKLEQRSGRGAVGNGFRQRLQFFARKLAEVPVAGDTHLGKGENFHTASGCILHEVADSTEVVLLVTGRMLELYSSHPDVSHTSVVRL